MGEPVVEMRSLARLSRRLGLRTLIPIGVRRPSPNRSQHPEQLMSDLTTTPARYLRTSDAGRLLGLSGRTLEKHRTYGTGPTYRKIGGLVVYTVEDLQAWADRGIRSSTSEIRRERVYPARRIPRVERVRPET